MKLASVFTSLAILTGSIIAVPAATAADVDAYPTQPIKLLVPFPPGGGTDSIARFLASALDKKYGWNIVVENRPGAGGTVGLGMVARAEANGYTVGLGQTSNLSINPHLYSKISYNVAKDFVPVIALENQPMVLLASSRLKFGSVSDLIAYAKRNPGKLAIGNAGTGTVGDITGRFFAQEAGIDVLHVPYKGAAPAMNDLLGGQVDAYFASAPAAMTQSGNDKISVLAVSTTAPVSQLPNVPLLADTLPGFEAASKSGLIVPAGTPQSIVVKLNEAVNDVLKSDELRTQLTETGSMIAGGTPKDFADVIASDSKKWAHVIDTAGIHID